ncbi:hypothetical protein ACFSCX_24235 [Bacillus salitolerans]|uniref:Uncharacterized protein n=1 Tax=Bacillus salitolerans TaxID=1437434 RepID=A0ABW4LXG5_9BACI
MIIFTLFLCIVSGYFFVIYLIHAIHNDNDPVNSRLAALFFILWTFTVVEMIGEINGVSLLEMIIMGTRGLWL